MKSLPEVKKCRDYDNLYKCPICGKNHTYISKDSTDNIVCEAETICTCGHKDYWAYGFFQSIMEGKNKH